jgi:hypothetical protein
MDLLFRILSLSGFVLFHVSLLAGVLFLVVGLPGTWVILAASFLFALFTGFEDISRNILFLLAGLAILGEVVEFLLGIFVAKKYGASKYGMWGAFLGGILGGMYGTMFVPFVGSLVGAMAGAFLGAFFLEAFREMRTEQRFRAGFGALVGRVIATTMKLGIGLLMVFVILLRLYS